MNENTTQRDRIYALLYRNRNQWVAQPEILKLCVAQWGTRINELRSLGADIRKKTDANRHSYYMLVEPITKLGDTELW